MNETLKGKCEAFVFTDCANSSDYYLAVRDTVLTSLWSLVIFLVLVLLIIFTVIGNLTEDPVTKENMKRYSKNLLYLPLVLLILHILVNIIFVALQ